MAAISKDAKRIARLIKENGMYDPDSESLFISNPGISFDVLKGLAKRHNFTIGQTKSGQYISIPTAFKHTREMFELYDDFLSTYTFFSKNYESLREVYSSVDQMDENLSEVSLILDTYAAEVLSQGFIENPLNIKISNKNAQTFVEKVLYKNKIYQRLPSLTRSLAKYGNIGLLLSYPYLETWMTEQDVKDFKRIDVLEDLIISYVNPHRFKVNTDEYFNVINYEVENEPNYVNTMSVTGKTEKRIWQPWQFCFTGDTKISLLDGRELSLTEIQKEFGEGEFWVYSCKENGRIVPGRAHSLKKTRENTQLVEVELDNGEKIHCTPDHKFMLRTGEYCEAQNLQPGISLMPLYRQKVNSSHNKRGYEQFFDNAAKKWMYTHWRTAEEIYGTKRDANGRFSKSYHVHHKDFNSLNNSPDNLQWLTCAEHNKVHAELIKDPIRSAHARKAASEALKKLWAENHEYMAKMCSINAKKTVAKRLSETGSKVTEIQIAASKRNVQKAIASNIGRKHNYTEEQLAVRREIGKRAGAKNKGKIQNLTQEQRLARSIRINNTMKILAESMSEEEYTEYLSNKAQKGWLTRRKKQEEAKKLYNHKVVAVRPYHNEDVYDFTVDDYHNFALSAGVFVHNCHGKLYDDLTEPYGKSMLWSMRSAFDQLTTLEGLLGISRASKLQRLVFYVPLPNGISLPDSAQFLNEFRGQYLNSMFSDTNAPKLGRKLPGAMSILTLPEAADGKKVTFDKIEANIDLSQTEDVEYFLDKILRNSKLPKGYLVGEDVITTAQTLEAQDLKLKRALIPLTQGLLNCMMNLVENILTHGGYDVSKMEIEVSLNEPIQIPADIIDKYNSIGELLKSFIELNPEMKNINKFLILIKLGLPTDIASLVCSNVSMNILGGTNDDLIKFLDGQKVKDPNAIINNPDLGESVTYRVKSDKYNKENLQHIKLLKEVYETMTHTDMTLKESCDGIFKSEKVPLNE